MKLNTSLRRICAVALTAALAFAAMGCTGGKNNSTAAEVPAAQEPAADEVVLDEPTAESADPIIGKWRVFACGTTDEGLESATDYEDCWWIDLKADGTFEMLIVEKEAEGAWMSDGTQDGTPWYKMVIGTGVYYGFIEERDDVGPVLIFFASDTPDQYVLYRR